jgi:hypothetical protein
MLDWNGSLNINQITPSSLEIDHLILPRQQRLLQRGYSGIEAYGVWVHVGITFVKSPRRSDTLQFQAIYLISVSHVCLTALLAVLRAYSRFFQALWH